MRAYAYLLLWRNAFHGFLRHQAHAPWWISEQMQNISNKWMELEWMNEWNRFDRIYELRTAESFSLLKSQIRTENDVFC